MSRNKCKTCGSNFSERSRIEFQGAPGWKDECPRCTKVKFETFVGDYLVKLVGRRGAITLVNEYFSSEVPLEEDLSVEDVLEFVTRRVYKEKIDAGGKRSTTAGLAIASFVSHVEGKVGKNATKSLQRRSTLLFAVIAFAIVILAVLILFSFFPPF